MYDANGISLTESEYRMLKKLVRKARRGKDRDFAKAQLRFDEGLSQYNRDAYVVLTSLHEVGLVDLKVEGGFIEYRQIDYRARDFVRACRKGRRREFLRAYLPSLIAVAGSLGGVAMGKWLL